MPSSSVFKGLVFPSEVAPLVRYMSSLNDHRETLAALSGTWDTLSMLGHLSNLQIEMRGVRQGFSKLTGELLSCLAEETLSRTTQALGYQAQIAVDVLTRNLFERTADIGFLATDTDIVAACSAPDTASLDALRRRFRVYAERYTVYSDIVLLDAGGNVLARMNDGFAGKSSSNIVVQALSTTAGYVETYAPTDFCSGAWALTYAYRVVANGRTVGVLALEFDLRREAKLIFDRLATGDELFAFLNADDRVLVSSDRVQLPASYKVPVKGGANRLRLGGVQYVVSQRSAQSYQGYPGPGWSVVALTPAELAFEGESSALAEVAFSGENVFSTRLRSVPAQAREIQRSLDRLVWNGRVQQADDADKFSRALLEEISNTGRQTKDVFERSSAELLATVASSLLSETQFLAGLSVDILDRNLYERANDCRWWAASPALATMDAAVARETLAYINGLYTVYSNIFLFDESGRVLAASQDATIEGEVLDAAWVAECLALRDPIKYAVSMFEGTALYAGQGTYVYSAPVIKAGRVIGGVGLVFDSTPQFEAMLRAALPAVDGAVAVFLHANGSVISQTGALPLSLSDAVHSLVPGESWSGVLVQDGQCFAVGATAGSGYREFKTTDGYNEPVIGVIVVPCGTLVAGKTAPTLGKFAHVDDGTEIATFYIGDQLLGLVAKEIVECIEVPNAVSAPRGDGLRNRHVGYTTWKDLALPLLDISTDMGATVQKQRHAIVLKQGDLHFGVLVSELGPIAEMQLAAEQNLQGIVGALRLISQLARAGETLVPVLSPAALLSTAKGDLDAAVEGL